MSKDALLMIVLNAIRTVGDDVFKSTSMFTNIEQKKSERSTDNNRSDIKKAA